jgi:hypothetical protein
MSDVTRSFDFASLRDAPLRMTAGVWRIAPMPQRCVPDATITTRDGQFFVLCGTN